jgi:hypothetical protein
MSPSSPQVVAPEVTNRTPGHTGVREATPELQDKRALRIIAKTIYRELREAGLAEEDVMCVAGELLSHVTSDVKARR